MKKKSLSIKIQYVLITVCISLSLFVYSQDNDWSIDKQQMIQEITSAITSGDKQKVSELIFYPLKREYPLPDIQNRNDFIKRFEQVFDDDFVQILKRSNISDWSEMGWRGIMFQDGRLWIDETGKVIAVNYQSEAENELIKQLIEKDKYTLPEDLRDFEEPVYKIETKTYRIRIDKLSNDSYRYVSWKVKDNKKEPDIILKNGEWHFQGSGGNHTITFRNKNYTYEILVDVIGNEQASDILLIVYKDSTEILSQKGSIISK